MAERYLRKYDRLRMSLQALRELGPRQLGLYAYYQAARQAGLYRRRPQAAPPAAALSLQTGLFSLPEPEALAAVIGPDEVAGILAEAGEIIQGRVRLFGGAPVPLALTPPGPLGHWTSHAGGLDRDGRDIKWTWEPGRFGWAFSLGRAYRLSGDEGCADAFWKYTQTFLDGNPPEQGPHWASAQEVALRLMALGWAAGVFAGSPHTTPARRDRLAVAIAAHAARIPPTLAYARAQNNNHLLTESAGLYTAALLLPQHPQAPRWRALGWRWFHQGLRDQIAPDGAYIQHSSNYHRLMLQAALWVFALSRQAGQPFPAESRQKLALAVRWLLALVDPGTGRVPNLGPNDGAVIIPLATCPFEDYRPALQAAASAFLGEVPFPRGPWDDLSVWIGDKGQGIGAGHEASPIPPALPPIPSGGSPHLLRPASASWAYLRAAHFTGRPGHADQLHLDLWWQGLNVARDAGTYLYNAPPPWDNSLASTRVHNTLVVEGQDQMTRAGRFLWLDWAQAQAASPERTQDGAWERLSVHHDGYRRLGIIHQRTVVAHAGGTWDVLDRLLLTSPRFQNQARSARLHWLLPDWPWEAQGLSLRLASPHGPIEIRFSIPAAEDEILPVPGGGKAARQGNRPDSQDFILRYKGEGKPLDSQDFILRYRDAAAQAHSVPGLTIARAGARLLGSGDVQPIDGWVSPTYGHKIPALSVSLTLSGSLPLSFLTEFILSAS